MKKLEELNYNLKEVLLRVVSRTHGTVRNPNGVIRLVI